MKSLEGKQLTHVDGRQGYCVSARPSLGHVTVIVGGKREQWGQNDVRMESFLDALGLLAKEARA